MKKIGVFVPKSKTSYPIVEVVWDDHHFDEGDKTLKEIIKESQGPYVGSYVGYLVYENKTMIVLCANVWDDDDLSCPMSIMKKNIVSRSDQK